MGKSSRGKRQDQGAESEGGDTPTPADRAEAGAESLRRLMDPQQPPAEVARLLAAEFPDWVGAGMVAQMRLGKGVPAAEVAEVLRLLLAAADDPPALAVLSFAASVAHAEGDEEAEHRHTADLLARARDAGGRLWLDVARFISGSGHPGEAIELAEPYIRENPADQDAAFTYSVMLSEAAALPSPGDRELAALERFADRSGLAEIKSAVIEFMQRTPWGDLVRGRGAATLDLVPGRRLRPAALEVCAALALEAAVRGSEDGIEGMTAEELIELYRGGQHQAQTVLTAFATDPDSPPALARRAADWAEHAHYGLWQMLYPESKPGVPCLDLASGARRYIAFPPGATDGVPRWTVWLGGVIPVDGVWRATGAGIRLSPVEADAVAEAVDQALAKLIMTTAGGMPLAEMLPPEPVPYGKAPPWGVRWDYFDPRDERHAQFASNTVMMLAPRLVADVELHRARHPPDAADSRVPAGGAWLDQPLPALHGRTPREAARGDTPFQMLLESLLRQFEYKSGAPAAFGGQGADVDRLRSELGMGGE
jgi:hypothetical protein